MIRIPEYNGVVAIKSRSLRFHLPAVLLAVLAVVLSTLFFSIPAAAEDTRTSLLPFPDISEWKVTQDEALAIGLSYVPEDVAENSRVQVNRWSTSNMKTSEYRVGWYVIITGFSMDSSALGWQPDDETYMRSGDIDQVTIEIDGVTGQVLRRSAAKGFTHNTPLFEPALYAWRFALAAALPLLFAAVMLIFVYRRRHTPQHIAAV